VITDNPLKGFDIYHGDGIVQLGLAKEAGYDFMFAKSSEGATGVDPMYASNRARAKEVGLTFGAYHFFTAEDPLLQAEHFLHTAIPAAGEIIPVLDVETDFQGVASAALKCADVIKSRLGRYPIIYSGQAFYLAYLQRTFPATDYKIWIARYDLEPDPVIAWTFWQDSESCHINGTDHGLDTDVFFGSADELRALTIN
jgi:lysozyme